MELQAATGGQRAVCRGWRLGGLISLAGLALLASVGLCWAAQRKPAALEIVSVRPATADPESTIRLQLSRPLVGRPVVFFGRISADVEAIEKTILVVKVPAGLPPGARPMLTVRDADTESSPNFDFQVSPLRILGVAPQSALPGASVTITPSRRLGGQSIARVEFNGELAPVEEDTKEGIRVKVPGDLKPGTRPDVVLYLGKVSSEPYRGFTVRQTWADWIKSNPILIGLGIAVLWLGTRKLRERARRRLVKSASLATKTPAASGQAPAVMLDLPKIEIPGELVLACAKGECVLYAGAGLSAQAGLPLWKPFVSGLRDWAVERQFVDEKLADSLRHSLDRGLTDLVADSIVSDLKERQQDSALHEYLKLRFVEPGPAPSKIHRLLARIGLSAALTTNFDTLLEQTFTEARLVCTPEDPERLLDSLSQRSFFILKLYGMLERPDTVLVAPAQYEEAISGNRFFSEFMEKLFFSRTILFLGASLEGIEAYLKGVSFQSVGSRRHLAVVAVSEAGWETKADLLKRRYGIQVLPYPTSQKHQEVLDFVKELADKVKERTSGLAEAGPAGEVQHSRLERIELKNIGPFERLELDLNPRLTILLGDNGVGKSTILKAIAVAVAGKDAEQYAGRFVRSGEFKGDILIKTTEGEYTTEITRTSYGSEVKSKPSPPFADGNTLVLGFPPLRTVSWQQPKGPDLVEGRARPMSNDVLPIITPDADPRIKDLKDWIINMDYRRRAEGADASRVDALFSEFFDTLNVLLEGVTIKYKSISTDDKRIIIKTDDGEVPLEQLSQGTVSVLGWIGVLMQRLFEVYSEIERPRDQYALVLMDELDAHMHPEWQQVMVHKILTLFPNVQFIVTTHSPFIVAGREADQIIRLRRDEESRKVVVERPDVHTKGMGVASILTSYLFSLDTYLDPRSEERLFRKRKLTAKEDLTDREKVELDKLTHEWEGSDYAATDPDPLYARYLKAMAKLEQEGQVSMKALTKEEQEEQVRITEKIIRGLQREQHS